MASAAASSASSQVSQDQFLQLMVAQLKSQDPLQPTSNGEFLAQLAQFSTLSGVEKLNTSFGDMLSLQEITQGSNLIGRNISYTNAAGAKASGTVKSVGVTDGAIELQINSDSVKLSQIVGLSAAAQN
jgi:flagellar basal-body rod modification protein FlgD